jgi:hypothetical protein
VQSPEFNPQYFPKQKQKQKPPDLTREAEFAGGISDTSCSLLQRSLHHVVRKSGLSQELGVIAYYSLIGRNEVDASLISKP